MKAKPRDPAKGRMKDNPAVDGSDRQVYRVGLMMTAAPWALLLIDLMRRASR